MKRFLKALIRTLGLWSPVERTYSLVSSARRIRRIQEFDSWQKLKNFEMPWFKVAYKTSSEVFFQTPTKKALLCSYGQIAFVPMEAFLVKVLSLAGYQTDVLAPRHPFIQKVYETFGVTSVLFWDSFLPRPSIFGLKNWIHSFQDANQLLKYKENDVFVGKYACSSLMRKTRNGDLNLACRETKKILKNSLEDSQEATIAAESLFKQIQPQLVLGIDRGYSPLGQIFDVTLRQKTPFITFNAAHKNNALLLKRYTNKNRDVHPASLSAENWEKLKTMPWSDSLWQRVRQEFVDCYEKGEWYSEVGTQLNKSRANKNDLIKNLGLDPQKKVACVFPHIFWDATFFWGSDLFRNYEDWFIQVVQQAIANPHLNWILKIHPANMVKDHRDGYKSEHSEILALKKYFGKLPEHIHVLPADSKMSTLSIYDILDYCLTVRGTPGIEAACWGAVTLTAGTGRYDRLGFTTDFDTAEDYLNALSRLHEIPPLSQQKQELARRYAYGWLLGRTLPLTAVEMSYLPNLSADPIMKIRSTNWENFCRAPDVQSLRAWFQSDEEDFFQNDLLKTIPREEPPSKEFS